jgi:hypothetical protein
MNPFNIFMVAMIMDNNETIRETRSPKQPQPPSGCSSIAVASCLGGIVGLILGIILWFTRMPHSNKEGADGYYLIFEAVPITIILIILGGVIGIIVGAIYSHRKS